MLKLLSIFFCVLFSTVVFAWDWSLTESRKNGKAALENAFAKSSAADYITVIEKPAFAEFPQVTRAVYFQRTNENSGKDIALELYSKGQPWMRFVQNSEGTFAYSVPYDYAVKGGFFLRLYTLRSLCNPVYEKEMTYSDYSMTTLLYANRQCVKISMCIPEALKKDEPAMRGFTNARMPSKFPAGSAQYGKDTDAERLALFLKTRACVREFIIDKKTGVVLSRKEFTSQGQLLSQMELGKFDLNPDWSNYPHIFDTPGNIRCEVRNTKDLAELLRHETLKQTLKQSQQTAASQKSASAEEWLQKLWNGLLDYGHWVFMIIAVAAIGVLVAGKLKER